MAATVLAFPTTRKRAYPNRYVRRDDLPEGVVRMPTAEPTRYPSLNRTPELALLMAILSSMDAPIRWRIAKEVRSYQEAQGPGGYADDLCQLLMNLPWHIEEQ